MIVDIVSHFIPLPDTHFKIADVLFVSLVYSFEKKSITSPEKHAVFFAMPVFR